MDFFYFWSLHDFIINFDSKTNPSIYEKVKNLLLILFLALFVKANSQSTLDSGGSYSVDIPVTNTAIFNKIENGFLDMYTLFRQFATT